MAGAETEVWWRLLPNAAKKATAVAAAFVRVRGITLDT